MPIARLERKYAGTIGCGLLDEAIRLMPAFDEALATGDMLTIHRLLELYIKALKDFPQHMTDPRLRNAFHASIALNEHFINKLGNDVSALQELIKFWDDLHDQIQLLLSSLN